MHINEHGGHCCGIKHILGFPTMASERAVSDFNILVGDFLAEVDEGEESEENGGTMLLEAVLTDYQLAQWGKILTGKGFKLVNSFTNVNSGNDCNIYHFTV